MIKNLQKNCNSNSAIYLQGMRHEDLTNILNYCYTGAVDVSGWSDEEVQIFLDVAQNLGIKGNKINIMPFDKNDNFLTLNNELKIFRTD